MSDVFELKAMRPRATLGVLMLLGACLASQGAGASPSPTDPDVTGDTVLAEQATAKADNTSASLEIAVLAERARADGLADDPQTAALLREAADPVLAQAERDHLLQSVPVSQADIAARFAERPGDFDEFRLSHIFIAEHPDAGPRREHPLSQTQALARAQMLRRRLQSGADFAQVAVAESDDGATSAEGGELSSMFGRSLDAPFEVPVRALAVGEVSEPVRGPRGYHLIRLEEKHAATLERIGGMIEVQLREERRDRAIAQLVQEQSAAAGLTTSNAGQQAVDVTTRQIRQ
ncbi:peptidyl-prolyl cis-trans isomerase [Xanthomonas campestris pv. zinniae]|nr:peptidyl-prolyl cis-trans isomerase [Xanthomonas campestris pv. zinniae]